MEGHENAAGFDVSAAYESVREEAHGSLEEMLAARFDEWQATNAARWEAESLMHAALQRRLHEDDEYKSSIERVVKAIPRPEVREEPSERVAGHLSKNALLDVVSGSGIKGVTTEGQSSMVMALSKDTSVQAFSPPYPDSWAAISTSHSHLAQIASADKNTGHMHIYGVISNEGGGLAVSAAEWVYFARRGPGPGVAQVRTYTPYDYQWHEGAWGGAAHQHAGFGVYVLSWEQAGGGKRVDQDHQYWAWSDGASWFQSHGDYGSDFALNYQHQAPYFPILPGRVYAAAIWCFWNGYASGEHTFYGAGADGRIQANVGLVAVGQQ